MNLDQSKKKKLLLTKPLKHLILRKKSILIYIIKPPTTCKTSYMGRLCWCVNLWSEMDVKCLVCKLMCLWMEQWACKHEAVSAAVTSSTPADLQTQENRALTQLHWGNKVSLLWPLTPTLRHQWSANNRSLTFLGAQVCRKRLPSYRLVTASLNSAAFLFLCFVWGRLSPKSVDSYSDAFTLRQWLQVHSLLSFRAKASNDGSITEVGNVSQHLCTSVFLIYKMVEILPHSKHSSSVCYTAHLWWLSR